MKHNFSLFLIFSILLCAAAPTLVAQVFGKPRRGWVRVLAVADRLEEGIEPDGYRITSCERTRVGYRIDDACTAGGTEYGRQHNHDGQKTCLAHRHPPLIPSPAAPVGTPERAPAGGVPRLELEGASFLPAIGARKIPTLRGSHAARSRAQAAAAGTFRVMVSSPAGGEVSAEPDGRAPDDHPSEGL